MVLTGRVDEVRDGVVFGWAADLSDHETKAGIEVYRDGDRIAVGTADRARDDLVDGGLGDGRHAFEVRLPEGMAGGADDIRVVARTARGASIDLDFADAGERHLERLFDRFSAQWSEEAGALRRTLLALRDETGGLASTVESCRETATRVAGFDGRLGEIERRLDETDVFLVRIDASIRDFDRRVRGGERRGFLARLFRGRR